MICKKLLFRLTETLKANRGIFMKLEELIDNSVEIETESYSCIIGEEPSKGARSPMLWNHAFSKYGIDNLMLPFDVQANNLNYLLEYLNDDKSFIGGAITMPYKEVVFRWLGSNVSSEANSIGAVNCLYRNQDGDLYGTNTDGEAALVSANKVIGSLKGKKVLQLGCGGAGRAVAAFLSSDGADITIALRDVEKIQSFAKSIEASIMPWSLIQDEVQKFDIIVNTTSIGFRDDTATPIEIKHLGEEIKNIELVFDIIYEPLTTPLLARAEQHHIKTLNGLDMNLEQAVLAFNYANSGIEDKSHTGKYMMEVS